MRMRIILRRSWELVAAFSFYDIGIVFYTLLKTLSLRSLLFFSLLTVGIYNCFNQYLVC